MTQRIDIRPDWSRDTIVGTAFGVLAVFAAVRNIGSLQYPLARDDRYFHEPLFDVLAYIPYGLHLAIYIFAIAAACLFLLHKRSPYLIGYVAAVQLYSLLVDYFSYHHDVFLSFLLFTSIAVYCSKHKRTGLVLAKSAVVLAYLFSAAAKMQPDFLSGEVVETLLNQNPWILPVYSKFGVFKSELAWFAMVSELVLAIVLFVGSGRWLLIAIIPGLALHFGILLTGTGTLFNSIFPASYLLWLSKDFRLRATLDESGLKIDWGSLFLFVCMAPFFFIVIAYTLKFATDFGYLLK